MTGEQNMRRDLTEEELDRDWRHRCQWKAQALWKVFAQEHPYLQPDPDPGKEQPHGGVATPARFAAYLERATGFGGWRVTIQNRTQLGVEPPLRVKPLRKFGIQLRKVDQ